MGTLFIILAVIFTVLTALYLIAHLFAKDRKCKKYGHDIMWYPFVALNSDDMRPLGVCRRCGQKFRKD